MTIIPPPLSSGNAQWYYASDANQPVGPFPFQELVRLSSIGVITPSTYVLEEGKGDWCHFSEFLNTERIDSPIQSAPSGGEVQNQRKTKRLLLMLFLIWFFPIGLLVLLWKSDLSRKVKIDTTAIGTLFCVLPFLMSLIPSHRLTALILFLFYSGGLALIWIRYSKRTGIIATAITAPFFILYAIGAIFSDGRSHYPSLSPSGTPVIETNATPSSFNISMDEFKRSYNQEVDRRGTLSDRFRIRRLEIHSGDEGIDTFTVKYDADTTLIGSIVKSSGKLRDIMVVTPADTGLGVTTPNMLNVPPLCVSGLDPSTDSDFRIAELINQAFDHHDAQHTSSFGNVRVDVALNSKLKLMMFALSPKR